MPVDVVLLISLSDPVSDVDGNVFDGWDMPYAISVDCFEVFLNFDIVQIHEIFVKFKTRI